MNKKTVVVLLIILIAIILALGLWWYFSKPGSTPTANQPTASTKPAGAIINPTASTPAASALPPDTRTSVEVVLDNLARNFGERVGSYSAENLVAAKQLVATLPVSTQVINSLITALPAAWQSVTTRVLKSEVTKSDAGSREYLLTTQRHWQGASGKEAINYKTLTVAMKKLGDNWQITNAVWQ